MNSISPSKITLSAIALIVVLLAVATIAFFLGRSSMQSAVFSKTASVQKADVAPPKAFRNINKDFTFPIMDNSEKVGDFKYTIESAQLQDQIIVKGERATSVSGRTFLIINLKLSNSTDKKAQINTRDYIRLSVGSNDKDLFAPDIHNDPVELQANSIKETRLGFAVNDADKDFKLFVGTIDGPKQQIALSFK